MRKDLDQHTYDKMATFETLRDLVNSLPSTNSPWGPPTTTETTLDGVPYAPFSKGDKLGRMADWTSEGKDNARGGRQQYQQRYRDQIYGAGGLQTVFNIEGQNEEGSFSLVDRSQTSTRGRGFGGRGSAVFRGRGQRGGQAGRGGRGAFQRSDGGRGGRGGAQGYDSRGGRGGGRGGRRFGWKDWDKPQRNREASVQPKDSWRVLE